MSKITQDHIESAVNKSLMKFEVLETIFLAKELLTEYNRSTFGKERILLTSINTTSKPRLRTGFKTIGGSVMLRPLRSSESDVILQIKSKNDGVYFKHFTTKQFQRYAKL